jgi:predicted NodU family carbamoyl transferase
MSSEANLARRARSVTEARRLCAAGGVAMNCVSIGKVIGDGLFDEVYVPVPCQNSLIAADQAFRAR